MVILEMIHADVQTCIIMHSFMSLFTEYLKTLMFDRCGFNAVFVQDFKFSEITI